MSSSQMTIGAGAPQIAQRPQPTPAAAPAGPAGPAAPGPAEPQAEVTPKADPEATVRQLRETVDMLNRQMERHNRDLGFSIDEKAGRNVVVVRSKASGEVVRQIPDETVLRVAHHIEDMKGILYSDKG